MVVGLLGASSITFNNGRREGGREGEAVSLSVAPRLPERPSRATQSMEAPEEENGGVEEKKQEEQVFFSPNFVDNYLVQDISEISERSKTDYK